MTTTPLRCPCSSTPGMVVRAVALPGAGWEEHDEQAVWQEIDD